MDNESKEKNKNLHALKVFFENDMKIKKTLINMAPSEIDDFDEASRIEYVDKLYKELDGLEHEFLASVKNLKLNSEVDEAIKNYFDKTREKILMGKYDKGICQYLYSSQFAGMNAKFVEEVKQKCVGYTMQQNSGLVELIHKARTSNELLHAIHSYIVNNNYILEKMPLISQKVNEIGENITLYGEENEVAQNIFNQFPLDMDCGVTDIISLQNKVLMMVRDKGHALTIDMDTSKQDGIEVKYFVPKLCNKDMIEKLPGINKSGITQSGATGFFVSEKGEIVNNLFEFIERVPTDNDIGKQIEEEKIEPIFGQDDVKEMVYKVGKDERKMSKIELIQKSIRNSITKLKERFSNKEEKEMGEK